MRQSHTRFAIREVARRPRRTQRRTTRRHRLSPIRITCRRPDPRNGAWRRVDSKGSVGNERRHVDVEIQVRTAPRVCDANFARNRSFRYNDNSRVASGVFMRGGGAWGPSSPEMKNIIVPGQSFCDDLFPNNVFPPYESMIGPLRNENLCTPLCVAKKSIVSTRPASRSCCFYYFCKLSNTFVRPQQVRRVWFRAT